ncbi:MAG TPA: hypothetical protein VFR90_11565 [Methylibium sp.]|uniref:hypothetical protein n=1 Tax=Methylibium sp. TaxID=2067992 RepID=UPI002DBA6D4A|nr:hypothetical protein [Methylibium sp.]HEU4459751.1 hypothetical protein [Methylibium sp.]
MSAHLRPKKQTIVLACSAIGGFIVERLLQTEVLPQIFNALNFAPVIIAIATGLYLLPSKIRGNEMNRPIFIIFLIAAGWSVGGIWALKLN